ncbi:MAG: hypothetical protein ABIP71_11770 [Verrucomicrobiota bacterium]
MRRLQLQGEPTQLRWLTESSLPLFGGFTFNFPNFKIAIFLGFGIFLTACNTMPLPPSNFSEPGWKIQHGQAVWRAKRDAAELAGEILLAEHSDGRTVLQFTKTPFPFVIVQTTPKSWQLEVPAQNKKYSAPGKPPARISWFHLPPALKGIAPLKPWFFDNLENENWHLENKKTGEMIEGFLNP